jgi:hypothetical protein
LKVVDLPLIGELGRAKACGWCGEALRHPAHVHHIHGKGAGRVDVRGNLIPLGGPWDCNCHGMIHDGNGPTRAQLLAATAARDGSTADAIEAEVYRLRRTPKGEPKPRKAKAAPKRRTGPTVAVACPKCGAKAKALVADFIRGRSRCACGGLHDRLARAS